MPKSALKITIQIMLITIRGMIHIVKMALLKKPRSGTLELRTRAKPSPMLEQQSTELVMMITQFRRISQYSEVERRSIKFLNPMKL